MLELNKGAQAIIWKFTKYNLLKVSKKESIMYLPSIKYFINFTESKTESYVESITQKHNT